MLSKLKKWWLLPISVGVPAGVLTGGYVCWKTPQCILYAGCHFYRLLTQMLVREVDKYALIFAGILAVLLLVIYAAGRCPGAIRAVLRIVLPLGVLALAGKLFLPDRFWPAVLQLLDDPDFRVWVRVPLAIGWLVACRFLWSRLKRRAAPPAAVSAPDRPPHPAGRILSRALPGLSYALLGLSLLFILLFLGINGAAGACWAWSAVAVRRQPNIILVMVCSLRADHLGCYGYDLNTTPSLDQFARESTRFALAVSPSSWTLWSTASILTSRYPERIFGSKSSYVLAKYSMYPALPLALSNLGYTTSAASDHAFLGEEIDFSYSFRQGFDYYDVTAHHDFIKKEAPQVTSIALKRVKQLKGRRFFQFLMYAGPHYEYTQHRGFVFGPSPKDALGQQWASSLSTPVSKAELAKREGKLARYNSEVAFTDHAIGEFFAGLKKLGLYDDSLIVFCGDHGEEFLEHGSYGHMATLYHEVIDVPLLIKFPRQHQGTVIGGKFPLIDLFPSIMAIINGDYSHLGAQGDSVDLPALLRCADKPIFCATTGEVRSVLSGHYKYSDMGEIVPWWEYRVVAPTSRAAQQLFDLRTDPGEYQDVTPRKPGVASSLIDLLHYHDAYLARTDTMSGPPRPISSADEERLRERLRALGYLQE